MRQMNSECKLATKKRVHMVICQEHNNDSTKHLLCAFVCFVYLHLHTHARTHSKMHTGARLAAAGWADQPLRPGCCGMAGGLFKTAGGAHGCGQPRPRVPGPGLWFVDSFQRVSCALSFLESQNIWVKMHRLCAHVRVYVHACVCARMLGMVHALFKACSPAGACCPCVLAAHCAHMHAYLGITPLACLCLFLVS